MATVVESPPPILVPGIRKRSICSAPHLVRTGKERVDTVDASAPRFPRRAIGRRPVSRYVVTCTTWRRGGQAVGMPHLFCSPNTTVPSARRRDAHMAAHVTCEGMSLCGLQAVRGPGAVDRGPRRQTVEVSFQRYL